MQRYFFSSFLFLLLLAFMLGDAIADKPSLPTVEFSIPMHFLAPGGEDVKISVGTYHVEPTESWLKLLPTGESGAAIILIEAMQGRHEAELTEAIVQAKPDAINPDIFHMAVLLPDGTGLEAVGSASGIHARASKMVFLKRLTRQPRKPQTLPRPQLSQQDSPVDREIIRLQKLMQKGPRAVPDKQTVISEESRQREQALVNNLLELRKLLGK